MIDIDYNNSRFEQIIHTHLALTRAIFVHARREYDSTLFIYPRRFKRHFFIRGKVNLQQLKVWL